MILFDKKENCSGCTACQHACPEQCIEMIADEKGFFYPHIEQDRCTNCGICVDACPLKGDSFCGSRSYETPKVYAVKHKDDQVRMDSSSGGAYTAISDYFLDNSGVVYGAAFNDVFKVCHVKAQTRTERDKHRGSKYVQSDLGNIFKEVESDLMDSKQVLFTGTPCQIAGLNYYLKNEYENLFCCDLVCHGVPSPQIFAEYVNHFSSDVIKGIKFRDKISGWHNSSFTIVTEIERKSTLLFNNPYCQMFLNNLILRPACYNCKYATLKRLSDITIADFWGIEKIRPDFDDDMGVSLIMLNNKKSEIIFETIAQVMSVIESDNSEFIQNQTNLKEPSKPAPDIEVFWEDYANHGFEYVLTKYTSHGLFYRYRCWLYRRLSKAYFIKPFWNIYKRMKYAE